MTLKAKTLKSQTIRWLLKIRVLKIVLETAWKSGKPRKNIWWIHSGESWKAIALFGKREWQNCPLTRRSFYLKQLCPIILTSVKYPIIRIIKFKTSREATLSLCIVLDSLKSDQQVISYFYKASKYWSADVQICKMRCLKFVVLNEISLITSRES